MNIENAKQVLANYLADSGQPIDSEVMQALEFAESNPELVQWMKQQNLYDSFVRKSLSEIPVPDFLEASLLKTVGVARPGKSPHSMGRTLQWLVAIAATLMLGTGVFYLLRTNEQIVQKIQGSISGTTPDSYQHFRDGMAHYIRDVYFQLDYTTKDLASIGSWLDGKPSPSYEAIPDELASLVPIGCKELNWKGVPVSLVCFHADRDRIVHLFIIELDSLSPEMYEDITSVADSHDLETGGWVTDSRVYLLVGSHPDVDIEFALGFNNQNA